MIHGLLMAFLLAIATPPQATTFKLSGTVVREDKLDATTAANQNQVRIQGPMTAIVTIGAGGTFEFANVRPGSYQVVVGPRVTMSPITVVVTDKDVTDFRVVIPLSNDVTGNVIVEGNAPRPRFTVTFNRVDTTANPVNVTATTGFTVTVPQGQYRITTSGLAAGYSVRSIRMGDIDALAQPVTFSAAPGQVLTITLGVSSPPPWVAVGGRVVGGASANVSMSGTAMAETLNAVVGPNGVFEFPRVLPGNYTLRTLPANPLAPPMPLSVGSANLTNVELRVPAAKEISGKITVRGNFPAPRLTLNLAPVGAQPAASTQQTLTVINGVATPTAAGSISIATNAGPDGLFKVTLPEGERAISIVPASIPPGYVIESITYGSVDLKTNPIRVAANDTSEIMISVDATQVRPRNISGKALGLLTTQGVRVVLQGGTLGTGVESPVAPDGSFSFTDILPGNYQIRLSLSGPTISTSVRVDNQDVTGVTITFPRRFYVAAHVVVEGDTGAAPAPKVTLEATSATGATVTATTIAQSTGGPMQLALPDGEHKISVRNIPAGYILKSLRYGTTDLQESPLKIDGPITWEIIVRLVKTAR
jgi:hypothetical protein